MKTISSQRLKHTFFIAMLLISASIFAQFQTAVETLDNEHVSLNELKGEKLTLLDFWATWCQPCVKAIPELIKIHDDYAGKGVQLIGVNVDGPRNLSKVKPFVSSMGITYPMIMDTDQDLMREFGVAAMPTLLVLNPDGDIVFAHEGYHPGEEKMIREKIDNLLNHE